MWRFAPEVRPTGWSRLTCAVTAMASVVLIVAALVLLPTGHAGITLVLLPVALVLASYATWLLEKAQPRSSAEADRG